MPRLKEMHSGPCAVWGEMNVESLDTKVERLRFKLESRGGDGSFLCFKKVSRNVERYFNKSGLSLEDYALNPRYADLENIPRFARPFEPGSRAEFGEAFVSISSSSHLKLTVQTNNLEEVFSGEITRGNVIYDRRNYISIRNKAKGVYAVGHEGLEDCSITGYLPAGRPFDIRNLKIEFAFVDYVVVRRKILHSIKYNNTACEWQVDSYEGTGDNCFEFVVIDAAPETMD